MPQQDFSKIDLDELEDIDLSELEDEESEPIRPKDLRDKSFMQIMRQPATQTADDIANMIHNPWSTEDRGFARPFMAGAIHTLFPKTHTEAALTALPLPIGRGIGLAARRFPALAGALETKVLPGSLPGLTKLTKGITGPLRETPKPIRPEVNPNLGQTIGKDLTPEELSILEGEVINPIHQGEIVDPEVPFSFRESRALPPSRATRFVGGPSRGEKGRFIKRTMEDLGEQPPAYVDPLVQAEVERIRPNIREGEVVDNLAPIETELNPAEPLKSAEYLAAEKAAEREEILAGIRKIRENIKPTTNYSAEDLRRAMEETAAEMGLNEAEKNKVIAKRVIEIIKENPSIGTQDAQRLAKAELQDLTNKTIDQLKAMVNSGDAKLIDRAGQEIQRRMGLFEKLIKEEKGEFDPAELIKGIKGKLGFGKEPKKGSIEEDPYGLAEGPINRRQFIDRLAGNTTQRAKAKAQENWQKFDRASDTYFNSPQADSLKEAADNAFNEAANFGEQFNTKYNWPNAVVNPEAIGTFRDPNFQETPKGFIDTLKNEYLARLAKEEKGEFDFDAMMAGGKDVWQRLRQKLGRDPSVTEMEAEANAIRGSVRPTPTEEKGRVASFGDYNWDKYLDSPNPSLFGKPIPAHVLDNLKRDRNYRLGKSNENFPPLTEDESKAVDTVFDSVRAKEDAELAMMRQAERDPNVQAEIQGDRERFKQLQEGIPGNEGVKLRNEEARLRDEMGIPPDDPELLPPEMEGGLPKIKTPEGIKGESFKDFIARTMDGMTPDRFNQLPNAIRNGAMELWKESLASVGEVAKIHVQKTPNQLAKEARSKLESIKGGLFNKLIDDESGHFDPEELMRNIEQLRTVPQQTPSSASIIEPPSKAAELWNFTRGILPGADLTSVAFRQARPLMFKKAWREAWSEAVAAYGDEGALATLRNKLNEVPGMRPTQVVMGRGGKPMLDVNGQPIKISKFEQLGLQLTDRSLFKLEESRGFGTWPEQIPLGYGNLIKRGNRAAEAFANTVRVMSAQDMWDQAKKMAASGIGQDPDMDITTAKGIINLVNDMSGRASMNFTVPKRLRPLVGGAEELSADRYSGLANTWLFSPRLALAQAKMFNRWFNPVNYIGEPPIVRQQKLKGLLAVGGFWGTLTMMGKLRGGEISGDVTNSDFMKPKFGHLRIDNSGGLGPWLVLAGRLANQSSTSSTSGTNRPFNSGPYSQNIASVLGEFGYNKAHPMARFIMDLMRAENYSGGKGRSMNLTTMNPMENDITKQFIFMMIQDLHNVAKEDPSLLIGTLPAGIGAGAQSTQYY